MAIRRSLQWSRISSSVIGEFGGMSVLANALNSPMISEWLL